jgi:hypothetical protein
MFEQRSKDGKILFIVFYSSNQHKYTVNKYLDDTLIMSEFDYNLQTILDWIKNQMTLYNTTHPTSQRYHKLVTGDIYDNVTESIINHTALMGLLSGLESNDKKAISEAIAMLS